MNPAQVKILQQHHDERLTANSISKPLNEKLLALTSYHKCRDFKRSITNMFKTVKSLNRFKHNSIYNTHHPKFQI